MRLAVSRTRGVHGAGYTAAVSAGSTPAAPLARHGLRNVQQPLEHADEQELKQANNATAAAAAFTGRKACWLASITQRRNDKDKPEEELHTSSVPNSRAVSAGRQCC